MKEWWLDLQIWQVESHSVREVKKQFILHHRTQKAQELATAAGQGGLKAFLKYVDTQIVFSIILLYDCPSTTLGEHGTFMLYTEEHHSQPRANSVLNSGEISEHL